MSDLTLVIAWRQNQGGPLAIRLATDLRQAREIAKELREEYGWIERISFLKEVDYEAAPGRGSDESGQPPNPFLPDGGWDHSDL